MRQIESEHFYTQKESRIIINIIVTSQLASTSNKNNKAKKQKKKKRVEFDRLQRMSNLKRQSSTTPRNLARDWLELI